MPTADAQPAKQEAGKLFQDGNKLYTRGDIKGALEKFIKARKLFPSFKLDLNIATCLYDMGRHADAARELERFLDKAEKAPPAIIKEAHIKLSKLRRSLSSIKVGCNEEGATIVIDGKEVGQTPLSRRFYLRPGPHELKLIKEGFSFVNKELNLKVDEHRDLVITMKKSGAEPTPAPSPAPKPAVETVDKDDKGTAKQEVDLNLAKSPSPKPGASASSPIYKKWWFWSAIGVVVAGATVGMAVGLQPGEAEPVGGTMGSFPIN